MSTATDTTRFRVEGMDCASCAGKVDTAVRRLDGVSDVSVSVVSGTMTVQHTDAANLQTIANKVTSLGYKATALPDKPASVSAPPSPPMGRDRGWGGATHSVALHGTPDFFLPFLLRRIWVLRWGWRC